MRIEETARDYTVQLTQLMTMLKEEVSRPAYLFDLVIMSMLILCVWSVCRESNHQRYFATLSFVWISMVSLIQRYRQRVLGKLSPLAASGGGRKSSIGHGVGREDLEHKQMRNKLLGSADKMLFL